jgi:hypothetical protein
VVLVGVLVRPRDGEVLLGARRMGDGDGHCGLDIGRHLVIKYGKIAREGGVR